MGRLSNFSKVKQRVKEDSGSLAPEPTFLTTRLYLPTFLSDKYIQTQKTRKVATQGSQSSIHKANGNLVSAKYYADTFYFEC